MRPVPAGRESEEMAPVGAAPASAAPGARLAFLCFGYSDHLDGPVGGWGDFLGLTADLEAAKRQVMPLDAGDIVLLDERGAHLALHWDAHSARPWTAPVPAELRSAAWPWLQGQDAPALGAGQGGPA